jgi:predicted type IV restriction endonuclease
MSRSAISPDTAANLLTVALRQIADRIPRLRAQTGRISEEDTKRILITRAVEALGWDIHDIDEVRNEYRHNTADNPVDYALFLNQSPVLFVEAKPLGHSLDDRKWLVQTINYANAAGVDWCALTNGAGWRIYKVHAQVEADRKLFTAVAINNVGALDDAVRVLSLLSRENMRARAADELW